MIQIYQIQNHQNQNQDQNHEKIKWLTETVKSGYSKLGWCF